MLIVYSTVQICQSLAHTFVTYFLYIILIAIMFVVSFAMAIRSKVYALCFQSAGKDAYHD
jgi:hypothetical protein